LSNIWILKLMGRKYSYSCNSVKAMYEAGIPILVGTDANGQQGSPSQVPYGPSIHHKMELLVAAGLSPVDVLRGATSLAARPYGLHDRGVIEPGY
jgi:imidazolonepropionase-like amidohydrolase